MFSETGEAIAASESGASEEWKAAAIEALHRVALKRYDFTAADVYAELADSGGPETHDNRALGPIMLAGARKGWITRTDFLRVDEIRRWCHNQTNRVWESQIHQIPQ